jgi:hypothetical protein
VAPDNNRTLDSSPPAVSTVTVDQRWALAVILLIFGGAGVAATVRGRRAKP